MQKVLATLNSAGTSIEPEPDIVEELEAQLARHAPDRYPVQHATAAFHLATALIDLGRTAEAETLLRSAAELFEGRLPLERAKAYNLLGVALRQDERAAEAVDAFEVAAEGFASGDWPLEHGAARFNLGLALAEQDDVARAQREFRRALELLDAAAVPAQAAAAARELGATLLVQGDTTEAAAVLRHAVQLSDESEDTAGMGAAANTLGLALLAADDPAAAIEAFRTALSAHPRSVRPGDFAVVKANIALAHEALDDLPRARLAARQALGAPELPEVVIATAVELLERIGTPGVGDLEAILEDTPEAMLAGFLREELSRLASVPMPLRELEAGEWAEALTADPDAAYEAIVDWLTALLELPPGDMSAVIGAMVAAVARMESGNAPGGHASTFRHSLARAYARFHAPQAERVQAMFAEAAAEQGVPGWS